MNPKLLPIFIVLSVLLIAITYWIFYVYIDQPCSNIILIQYKRIQKHCSIISATFSSPPTTSSSSSTSLSPPSQLHLNNHLHHQHPQHQHLWSHYHEPSWICPLEKRIGNDILSAKWLCDPHQIHPHGIIYSYGTMNKSFEEIFVNSFKCDVYLFDPHLQEGIFPTSATKDTPSSSSPSSLSSLPSASSTPSSNSFLSSLSLPATSSLHISSEEFSSPQFIQSLLSNQFHGRNIDILFLSIDDLFYCSNIHKMSHIITVFIYENLFQQLNDHQITIDQIIFSFHRHPPHPHSHSHSHQQHKNKIDDSTTCQTYLEQETGPPPSSSHQINLLFHDLISHGYALYHREIIPRQISPSSSFSSSSSSSSPSFPSLSSNEEEDHPIDRIDYSFVKLNIDCNSLSVQQTSKYFMN